MTYLGKKVIIQLISWTPHIYNVNLVDIVNV